MAWNGRTGIGASRHFGSVAAYAGQGPPPALAGCGAVRCPCPCALRPHLGAGGTTTSILLGPARESGTKQRRGEEAVARAAGDGRAARLAN